MLQKMKKVLVVGGVGYLGGLVVDKLLEDGNQVTVYDNLLFEERYLKPVKFIYGDIRDTEKLLNLLETERFTTVVWLAALVGDPACEINLDETEQINHIAVKNFCEKLGEDSPNMIYYSTCSVYGINDSLLDETSPVNPISAYASTKYAAEKYVLDAGGIVFRLGTVFGLGDTYSRIRLDLVVNVMTMRAYLDGKIEVNGGEQWRPIISTIDIANFTVKAVNNHIPGIYNLAFRNVTMKDLGKEISGILNVPIKYNDIPYQDLRNYQVDGSKAIETFEYIPTVTVKDQVLKIHKLITEQRIKDLTSMKYHNGQYLRDLSEKVAAKI